MERVSALFGFTGRINRARFLIRSLIAALFFYAGVFIAFFILDYDDAIWLFLIAALWMFLAASVKRLHDMDRSARWLPAVILVPGFVFALALLRGTEGDNRFGADLLPPHDDALS
jgi:uncharacterized membrane protein YhaH (DUF805 family)